MKMKSDLKVIWKTIPKDLYKDIYAFIWAPVKYAKALEPIPLIPKVLIDGLNDDQLYFVCLCRKLARLQEMPS